MCAILHLTLHREFFDAIAEKRKRVAYKSGLIMEGFDWGEWGHGSEGKKL
jgi:hypothetical protein